MLRSLRILLAVLALAPIACDEPHPDDDGEATEATDDDGEATTADDDGDDATGEAIDPTPVPFAPPLRKPCHVDDPDARTRHCDP